MTNPAVSQNQSSMQRPLPAWIVSGVLGVMLGGGATFLGLQYYDFEKANAAAAAGAPSGGPPPGMAGGGMGGMMGGGGMGGGMGGGGPRGKRNLTTFVGKLDLASKGIGFQLDQEQSAQLAAQLGELEPPETMSQEEAQERCDALEEMLTDEQRETLALFELPRAGRGGGGGGRGSMPGGMGGPPAGMAGMSGPPAGMAGGMAGPPPGMSGPPRGMGGPPGGGGAPDDGNPFQEEANQARLHSLLDRLKGAAGDAAEEAAATDGDKTKEPE
jgi:hypothetical protein